MHRLFTPAGTSEDGLVEHAQDKTAPKGLLFYHAREGKPLATPWQVANIRASMVASHFLPEGCVLDCACGSGIQLAAYAATLQRPVLGVELDHGRAQASAVNLRTVARHQRATDADWFASSVVVAGDGTDPKGVFHAVGGVKKWRFFIWIPLVQGTAEPTHWKRCNLRFLRFWKHGPRSLRPTSSPPFCWTSHLDSRMPNDTRLSKRWRRFGPVSIARGNGPLGDVAAWIGWPCGWEVLRAPRWYAGSCGCHHPWATARWSWKPLNIRLGRKRFATHLNEENL